MYAIDLWEWWLETFSFTSHHLTVESNNSLITFSHTFYSRIWPSHGDCCLPVELRALPHTANIYQRSAGGCCWFCHPGCKQSGKAGERESRFRREQEANGEEHLFKSQGSSISRVFCVCGLVVFPVEVGWCGGTKHKETLFKRVQLRQLSQILYTSEWINPRHCETTVVCLCFLRANTQRCSVAPCCLMLLWKLFSSRFYTLM